MKGFHLAVACGLVAAAFASDAWADRGRHGEGRGFHRSQGHHGHHGHRGHVHGRHFGHHHRPHVHGHRHFDSRWYHPHAWSGPYFDPWPRWVAYAAPLPFVADAGWEPAPVYVERIVEREPIYVERIREREPVSRPPRVERRPSIAAAPATAPRPGRERLDRLTLSATELFGFDQASIQDPQPELDAIARAMKANPRIAEVRITGYTDRLGPEGYNLELSRKRAEAVKSYLVRQGVEAWRLVAIGKGEADPVVTCEEKDSAALVRCLEPNRRVVVEEVRVESRPGRG